MEQKYLRPWRDMTACADLPVRRYFKLSAETGHDERTVMHSPPEVLRYIPEIYGDDLFAERAYQILSPISWRYPFFQLIDLACGEQGAFDQFSIALNDRKRKGHAGLLSACAAVFFRQVFVQLN